MKQNLQAVLDDDRGVSPVIGVILMVAITVILAAVIGTFVLGLGDSLNQAPQSTLNADSNSSDTVTISHDGGDALAYSDITIQINSTDVTSNYESDDSDSELGVGDSVSVDISGVTDLTYTSGNTVTVTVIHDASESILFDAEVDVQEA